MDQLNLFDIEFPVYKLPDSYIDIWTEFNVLYLKTQYATYVLDNKNVDGDTVGKRRLHINNSKLYNPKRVFYNIEQFIHSKSSSIFMDSLGRCFKYKKIDSCKLVYHKVLSRDKLKSGECLLTTKIEYNIKMNCRRAQEVNYIGLLNTKYGNILYELSTVNKKDTWRLM